MFKLRGNNFKLLKYVQSEEAKPSLEEAGEKNTEPIPATISMEQDLERWLTKNIKQLEPDLEFIDNQYSVPPVGRVDVLAKDSQGRYVVIEIKSGMANEKAVGQLAAYVAKLKEQTSELAVRGILVAEDFNEKAYYAAKEITSIKLKRYKVNFEFEDLT